jgi:hypothetical protein
MSAEHAICTIRVPTHETSYKELSTDRKTELHIQWANAIQQLFFPAQDQPNRTYLRNWDIILNIDGSAENYLQNSDQAQDQAVSSAKSYPPRYQLPDTISERLGANEPERILRQEIFALGSILYEVATGHKLFHSLGDGDAVGGIVQTCIARGLFPEDLWGLQLMPRILGCWCPGLVAEMRGLSKRCMGFLFLFIYSLPL